MFRISDTLCQNQQPDLNSDPRSIIMNLDPNPHLSCVWSAPFDWDGLNIASVPDEPGFYAFTDHADVLQPSVTGRTVLYVGIATQSLRDRIRKYKTGDFSGISNMHRGGFMMFLSRATAHFQDGRLTHSVQRTPVEVTRLSAGRPPEKSTLDPNKFYLRWAVDHRAAIEALLIQHLNPKFNTMLV